MKRLFYKMMGNLKRWWVFRDKNAITQQEHSESVVNMSETKFCLFPQTNNYSFDHITHQLVSYPIHHIVDKNGKELILKCMCFSLSGNVVYYPKKWRHRSLCEFLSDECRWEQIGYWRSGSHCNGCDHSANMPLDL